MTALSAQGYGFPEFHPIVWSVPCFGGEKSNRPACQHHDELALLLSPFLPCISANCNQTRHRPLKQEDHDLEPVAAFFRPPNSERQATCRAKSRLWPEQFSGAHESPAEVRTPCRPQHARTGNLHGPAHLERPWVRGRRRHRGSKETCQIGKAMCSGVRGRISFRAFAARAVDVQTWEHSRLSMSAVMPDERKSGYQPKAYAPPPLTPNRRPCPPRPRRRPLLS